MSGWSKPALSRRLQVYFIMGSPNCRREPVETLREAIDGGVTMFQFREKGAGALAGTDKLALAWRLRRLCAERGVPFLVNDDVELALEVGADGVHVGQEDEAAAAVRRRIGPARILGVSAYDAEEAARAVRDGADYLGVGPLFATRTKEDAKAASGAEAISRIREAGILAPIVGIGGIDVSNAAAVIRAGADGVSVISAISQAPRIREATEALTRAVGQAIETSGLDETNKEVRP